MGKPPLTIKEHLNNARYYLEAADQVLAPRKNAAHLLLLIIAYENYAIAVEELCAWEHKSDVNGKVYRDHGYKLRIMAPITRHSVVPGKAVESITFDTGQSLAALRLACQYGSNTESKSVERVFDEGNWDFESTARELHGAIDIAMGVISQYEPGIE